MGFVCNVKLTQFHGMIERNASDQYVNKIKLLQLRASARPVKPINRLIKQATYAWNLIAKQTKWWLKLDFVKSVQLIKLVRTRELAKK
jgi:hypothetical protein